MILLVFCALGIAFAPQVVRAVAPGFTPGGDTFDLAVTLTRWCLPYIFFISLVALAGGVLNSLGHFFAPAVAPLLMNLSVIAAALTLHDYAEPPVLSLAFGVVVGGVIQLLAQIPYLDHYQVDMRPAFALRHPAIKRIGRLMLPAIFGAAVYQFAVFTNTLLASFLEGGSVSYLYYADRLIQFPLGIFAIAVGTAVLPSLSRQAAEGDHKALIDTMGFGLRLTVFINLPAMVGLLVFGPAPGAAALCPGRV